MKKPEVGEVWYYKHNPHIKMRVKVRSVYFWPWHQNHHLPEHKWDELDFNVKFDDLDFTSPGFHYFCNESHSLGYFWEKFEYDERATEEMIIKDIIE